jgi:hypothetical protein
MAVLIMFSAFIMYYTSGEKALYVISLQKPGKQATCTATFTALKNKCLCFSDNFGIETGTYNRVYESLKALSCHGSCLIAACF